MQNLIILLSLSFVQVLSATFLAASVIVILLRTQKYHSTVKTPANIAVVSVLSLAISTALILHIDLENMKDWKFALTIVDVLSCISGASIGVQNAKKS